MAEISYLLGSKDSRRFFLVRFFALPCFACASHAPTLAQNERSQLFERLKTWLRNTMGQKRLTHLEVGLMATNIDILLNLDRNKLMNDLNDFIYRTPERRSVFGCF